VKGCKDDGGSSMIISARLINKAAKFRNMLDLRKLQNADPHEHASQRELCTTYPGVRHDFVPGTVMTKPKIQERVKNVGNRSIAQSRANFQKKKN